MHAAIFAAERRSTRESRCTTNRQAQTDVGRRDVRRAMRPLAEHVADHVEVRKTLAARRLDVMALAELVPAAEDERLSHRIGCGLGIHCGLGSQAQVAEFSAVLSDQKNAVSFQGRESQPIMAVVMSGSACNCRLNFHSDSCCSIKPSNGAPKSLPTWVTLPGVFQLLQ